MDNIDQLQKQNEIALRKQEIDHLNPIDYSELVKQVKTWMLVEDPGIIKLIPILLVANQIPGTKPVWSFIVGPSGGGKTEFIQAISEYHKTYVISLITPNTLLSGMIGKNDASLLPKINNKIVLFYDWTNITSQPRDAKNEIMGQLRDAYDGHVIKQFGTGKVREWGPGGKFGLIAGTTQMIDMLQQQSTALGERFLNYRIKMPNRLKVGELASKNAMNKKEMEKGLANAFLSFMKGVKVPTKKEDLPTVPDEFRHELVLIADFVTRARSAVIRDFGMKKDVIFVPTPEMPTRIVQQLMLVAVSDMIISGGELTDVGKGIVKKYAFDSIPLTNMMAIKQMARKDELTTKDIAVGMGYPTAPVRIYLENLSLLGICKRISGEDSEEGGNADRWSIRDKFKDLIRNNFTDELNDIEAKFEALKAAASNKNTEEKEVEFGLTDEEFNNIMKD